MFDVFLPVAETVSVTFFDFSISLKKLKSIPPTHVEEIGVKGVQFEANVPHISTFRSFSTSLIFFAHPKTETLKEF